MSFVVKYYLLSLLIICDFLIFVFVRHIMAYSLYDLETLSKEVNLVFDSCSKDQNEKIKLEVLLDKLSEIYGYDGIQLFKDTMIPTLGPLALNKQVTKDEFFSLTKNVIYTVNNPSNEARISKPVSRRTIVECSTPRSSSFPSNQTQFNVDDLLEISPISRSSISRLPRNQTLIHINESLEKRLSEAESHTQELEEKLKHAKEINLKITKDFESAREEANRLWNSEEKLLEALDSLKSLETKYKSLLNDFLKNKEIVETLEAHNNYLQQENSILNEEMQTKTQMMNKLTECYHSLSNETVVLKETVERLHTELNQLRSREISLNHRIEQLKNEKQELRLQLMESETSVPIFPLNATYTLSNPLQGTGTLGSSHLPNLSSVPNSSPPSLMMELSNNSEINLFSGSLVNSSSESHDERKDYTDQGVQTDVVIHCDAEVSAMPSPSEQLQSTRGTQTVRLANFTPSSNEEEQSSMATQAEDNHQENRRRYNARQRLASYLSFDENKVQILEVDCFEVDHELYSANEGIQEVEMNEVEEREEINITDSYEQDIGRQNENAGDNDVDYEELLRANFNDSLEHNLGNYAYQFEILQSSMTTGNELYTDDFSTPTNLRNVQLENSFSFSQIHFREIGELIQRRVSNNPFTETEEEESYPGILIAQRRSVQIETVQFPSFSEASQGSRSNDYSRSNLSVLGGITTRNFIRRFVFWCSIVMALMLLFAAFKTTQPYCTLRRTNYGNCYCLWDYFHSFFKLSYNRRPPPV